MPKRKNEIKSEPSAKSARQHWQTGLVSSMNDPELKIKEDDQIVIIKDKYPKAKHHFLILPKENIPNLKALKEKHLPLLKHMHREGLSLADEYNVQFRLGYHAVPSMSHLHLHVISTDMDSTCLKTKKHWNSFTTEYFVDSEELTRELEEQGKINGIPPAKAKELLDSPLICHVCKKAQKNMPALKIHIKQHF